MIDDGELDWKVIAINVEDPLAAELNDIEDVDAKMPGVVSGKRIMTCVTPAVLWNQTWRELDDVFHDYGRVDILSYPFDCTHFVPILHVNTGIREWFRWYKTPDDKPLNQFGYDEKALPKKDALEVIAETHEYWASLKAGSTDKGKLWIA